MKKIVVLPFLILLLGIVLTACGTAEQSSGENKTSSSTPQVLEEKAEFIGMADAHTVEVKKVNTTLNYEFTDNFKDVLNEFNPGDKVEISYFINDSGQKEIQEIKKVQQRVGGIIKLKKLSLTFTTFILLLLVFMPNDAAAASSISVKLSNYVGNKNNFNISSSGLYKVTGTNVSSVARYDGKNRYEVANSIASAGWKNPSTIVIVNRDAFADAISATPLAYKLNAPILYTNAEKLTKTTEKQIKKMNPDNILIIGGTTSVSSATEKALKKYGKIKRISGKSRYAVSQNIAKRWGTIVKLQWQQEAFLLTVLQ